MAVQAAMRSSHVEERTVDAIFSSFEGCRLPGVAVGIAIHGRTIYRKGFGLANLELPVLLSPTIRMRVASVSKQMTALAFMLLCEEGKAELDDPIGRYLPELHAANRQATPRQLMAHVSGLHDTHDIAWQFSGTGHAVSSDKLLALYCDMGEVNASPEVTWNYNNGGYLLLTAVIERITGLSLEDVLRERVFDPIGMYDTRLRRLDTDYVTNSAALHAKNKAGEFEKSFMGTALAGEGGVVSTVDDLLRWLIHMDLPHVGSVAVWEAMKAPHQLINGTSTGYGLGLIQGHYRGLSTLYHPGSVLGANAHVVKVPEIGLDVVVLANRDDVVSSTLAFQVLDAFLPETDGRSFRAAPPICSGVFRSCATGRVVKLFEREGHQFASVDGWEVRVVSAKDGSLCPTPEWNFIRKRIMPHGDRQYPTSVRLEEFGHVEEFNAIAPLARADATAIIGCYRSDQTHSTLHISLDQRGPTLTSLGRYGSAQFDLEYLAENCWQAKSRSSMPWGGILSWASNSGELHFCSARSRGLKFQRIA